MYILSFNFFYKLYTMTLLYIYTYAFKFNYQIFRIDKKKKI